MSKIKFAIVAIVIAIVLIAANHAFAGACDQLQVSGMTDSQIIELKKKCVDMSGVAASATVTANSMAEYAELGQKYGIALSEVAKSIGTTVNDLAQTPVGKFMLVLVAYKVMGNDLLGVVGSFIWFTTMVPLWIYLFHRMVLSTRAIKDTFDTNGKLSSRVINPVNWNDAPGPIAFIMLIVMLFICISGFVMAFG